MAETSTECHRYQAKIDSKDSSHTSVAEVVRVTTKGQLPPPARIRKDLDISECTCLLAVEVGDCIVHRRAETRSWKSRRSSRGRRNARGLPGMRSCGLSNELVEGNLGEVLRRFERLRFRHRVLRHGATYAPSHVSRGTRVRHLSG